MSAVDLAQAAATVAGGIAAFGSAGWGAWLLLRDRWRVFEIRFLDPCEPLAPEGMRRACAVGIPVGSSKVRASLRPRFGVQLKRVNVAFFDNPGMLWRLCPDKVGRRRNKADIGVVGFRYMDKRGEWHDVGLGLVADEASAADLRLDLYDKDRTVVDLDLRVASLLSGWDGTMSFQFHYVRFGNLNSRNVRTKMFVAPAGRRRPWNFFWKSVMRALPCDHSPG